MANAYSVLVDHGDKLETTENAQYVGAIQHAMQQKFDINLAKIEDLIGKVSTVPLVRDKDKKYLGDRLQTMLSMVDANSKLDLTDNTVASQINNYISSAVDDNVKEQISNSQKIYQFNNGLEELKVKDPKKYNEANHAYSLYKSGFDKYMKGESDSLGSMDYIPYTDKSQVIDELKKIKDLKGDLNVETVDNNGGKVVRKLSGLTSEEIYQYMPQLLSSQVLTQLRIDGWAKYKDNLPEAQKALKERKDQETETLDNGIKEQQAIIDNLTNTQEDRSLATKRLAQIKERKQQSEDNYKNIDINNPEDLGYYLEKTGYEYSIARVASGRENVTYEKDDVFFAQKDLEIKLEDLELKKQALAIKQGEATGKNAKGMPDASAYAQSSRATTDLPESPSFYKDAVNNHNEEYNKIVSNIYTAYSGEFTTDAQRTQFDANLAKKGYVLQEGRMRKIKGKENISKNFSSATAAVEAFTAAGINVSYPQQAKEVAKADVKRTSLATSISEADKKGYLNTFNKDADKYIQELKTAEEYTKGTDAFDAMYSLVSNPSNTASKAASYAGVGAAAGSITGIGSLIGGIGGGILGVGQAASENLAAHAKDLKQTNTKINQFVSQNGGWKNLKENIKNDAGKLKQLANLVEESIDKSPGLYEGFTDKSFATKAKTAAGEYLVEKNKTGGGAFFTTANEFNITTEAERARVINLVSQTDGNVTATFDKASPITAFKASNGNIVIRQRKGVDKSGNFKPEAEAMAEKGSALYNYLSERVNLTESNNGLNAQTATKMVIKPYNTPRYIDKGNQRLLENAAGVMENLDKSIKKEFQVSPTYYLSEDNTKLAFEHTLSRTMSKEDIAGILASIKNNMSNYELSVKPMDGVWGATVKDKDSNVLIRNGRFSEATPYLNDDLLNLTKLYPQVLIIDSILKYAVQHPEEAKTIFK